LFIVKRHREKETVFSLGLRENVEVVGCNYLKEEITIQLQPTAARRYKKEALVS
jgi:hypothetical protein